jgi:hypothetical protein
MKTFIPVLVVSASLVASSVASAQQPASPAQSVSAKRHPNLAAAQRFLRQAFTSISAAQKANEFDLDGHAVKAKNAIDEADRELKQAAAWSNKDEKK